LNPSTTLVALVLPIKRLSKPIHLDAAEKYVAFLGVPDRDACDSIRSIEL
jgi:hypothetical protein